MAESHRTYDSNNWVEIKDNPISKEGVFDYSGRNLARRDASGTIINGIDPDKIYKVYRPAEELSNQEAIDSFKLLPWTDDHPDKLLGPEAAGRRPIDEKGVRGVTGQEVYFKDGVLYANIKILSEYLKNLIDAGKKDISAGYTCVYDIASGIWNGIKYDAIQRNIRGNHVALVKEGRCGPDVAVLDHLTFTFDAKEFDMADKDDEKKKEMDARMATVCDWVESKMAKDAAEEEEKKKSEAKDAEEKEKEAKDAEEKKAACDKAAKDAEEAKEKKEGMDSVELKRVSAELAELKKSVSKSLMNEITKRDTLAADLSRHIGTFDHADKTLDEVSAYGVKTLGIKCPAGQEAVALSAYLEGRKAITTSAMDASFKKRTSAVDKFITGE